VCVFGCVGVRAFLERLREGGYRPRDWPTIRRNEK